MAPTRARSIETKELSIEAKHGSNKGDFNRKMAPAKELSIETKDDCNKRDFK